MNQNLPFRPLDNSSTTRLSYKREAELWSDAYRSQNLKSQHLNNSEAFKLIGVIFTIIISITTMFFGIVGLVIKRIVK